MARVLTWKQQMKAADIRSNFQNPLTRRRRVQDQHLAVRAVAFLLTDTTDYLYRTQAVFVPKSSPAVTAPFDITKV